MKRTPIHTKADISMAPTHAPFIYCLHTCLFIKPILIKVLFSMQQQYNTTKPIPKAHSYNWIIMDISSLITDFWNNAAFIASPANTIIKFIGVRTAKNFNISIQTLFPLPVFLTSSTNVIFSCLYNITFSFYSDIKKSQNPVIYHFHIPTFAYSLYYFRRNTLSFFFWQCTKR